MGHLRLFRSAAATACSIALAASALSAQDPDTLSLSGPFRMYSLWGTVGDDLAQVYANDYDHTWTLTMHGVTYSHGFDSYTTYDEWDEYLVSTYYTYVRATSFEFEFSGPNADVLNDVVSRQLVAGGDGGDVLILENSTWYSFEWESLIGKYGAWSLHLSPLESATGVSFHILGDWGITGGFASDADGYPLTEPTRVRAFETRIIDHRNGNYGIVTSFNDDVNFGSTEPPVVKPAVNILDGSVLEERKGTTRLNLTVKLTQFVTSPVTVNYATVDGTALKKSDYTARSGTLTFLPGQAEATIPLASRGTASANRMRRSRCGFRMPWERTSMTARPRSRF